MQVLLPIYKSTLICEGLNYHRTSICTILSSKLITNFSKLSSSVNLIDKHLANILHESLNYHLDTKLIVEQKKITLVFF